MIVYFEDLKKQFQSVLLKSGLSVPKAELCAKIFAENTRDGVYSHGLNRFPIFIQYIREGLIDTHAEPEKTGENGVIEFWDGHLAPGIYTATLAMQQAINLSKTNGMGCVSVKNTNHWMRGGTYGWQAAEAGCIGICASNTIANMPPWGGKDPRLGNNPLVISIPRRQGHIVLDMAISQFSYGKLQEYELKNEQLPIAGGYNEQGRLTTDPGEIRASKRILPIGYWKGSGLSLVLDVLLAALSGGRTVAKITADGKEYGLSQFFLCIHENDFNEMLMEEIIRYAKSSEPVNEKVSISYPGERTQATRKRNEIHGIPVNDEIWQDILNL